MTTHSRAWLLVAPIALLLAISPAGAQRPRQTPNVRPPAPATTSPWSSGAITVATSFRTVLAGSAARAAASQEILRQLHSRRPIAFVNGRWVTLVDLSLVYRNAAVHGPMAANLGTTPLAGQLANLNQKDLAARIGVVFTPSQLGTLVVGDVIKDISGSLAGNLFESNATDIVGADDILVAFFVSATASVLIAMIDSYVIHPGGATDGTSGLATDDPNADPDGDGVPNRLDSDDDGDTVPDEDDHYPYDPKASICGGSMRGCGAGVVAFTNGQSQDILAAVLTSLASGTTGAGVIALRPSVGRQPGLSIVFPAVLR